MTYTSHFRKLVVCFEGFFFGLWIPLVGGGGLLMDLSGQIVLLNPKAPARRFFTL